MKNWIFPVILIGCVALAACHKNTYERNDPNQSYERFISSHIFAACESYEKPYARYSLAKLLQRPSNDSPYYKVTFVNGPCKGITVWTTHVITKTKPVEDATLIETGTLVLRNFDNPKQQDKNLTDHWNVGVVLGTDRAKKGILDVGFPRDRNDFFPARESVYIHNTRLIVQPDLKDIRNFIN
ncbi:MAG: hypothetical protein IJ876_01085 [Elusimicrobiaceae bacterium]|nr:hypothetical protein [Elusimicrobiaceae bacterium]